MLVFLCCSKLYGKGNLYILTKIPFTFLNSSVLRRYCEDPENYKLINRQLLFETLIDVVLNDHSPNAAKSLEMKQIALRCLANLACDPILKPLFIQLGVHKILRSCIDDHQIYFDDDEVCFNKVNFQIDARACIIFAYHLPIFKSGFSFYVASRWFAPWLTSILILGKVNLKTEYFEFIQKVEWTKSWKTMLFLSMAWAVVLHQPGQQKQKFMKMENLFQNGSIGLISGSLGIWIKGPEAVEFCQVRIFSLNG